MFISVLHCCWSASLWCGFGSLFSLRCGSWSDFLLWCGSGLINLMRIPIRTDHLMRIRIRSLQSDGNLRLPLVYKPQYIILSLPPTGTLWALTAIHRSSVLSLLNPWILFLMWIQILLSTLMRIRIRLFTLMRIRIRLPKMVQIHADPGPKHWYICRWKWYCTLS